MTLLPLVLSGREYGLPPPDLPQAGTGHFGHWLVLRLIGVWYDKDQCWSWWNRARSHGESLVLLQGVYGKVERGKISKVSISFKYLFYFAILRHPLFCSVNLISFYMFTGIIRKSFKKAPKVLKNRTSLYPGLLGWIRSRGGGAVPCHIRAQQKFRKP